MFWQDSLATSAVGGLRGIADFVHRCESASGALLIEVERRPEPSTMSTTRAALRSRRVAIAHSLIASTPSRLSSSRRLRIRWSTSGGCGAQSKISPTTRSGCRVR